MSLFVLTSLPLRDLPQCGITAPAFNLCCFSSANGEDLNFIDYLWVPTNDENKTIEEKNIFCQVGKIHHWYTHKDKTLNRASGMLMAGTEG